MLSSELLFTGTQVNYYFICHRKLWLFSHNMGMERESEEVAMGKFLQQKSYERMEKAHVYQLLYYIYYLKKKGIEAEGMINYPLARQVKRIKLENEQKMEAILEEINRIVAMEEPPPARRKPYCKRCAYYEFCWGD